jgi:predicted MFS family arabinose efflux permease
MRVSKAEVVTLCLGNALGFCGPAVMPLWVAYLMHGDLIAPRHVGWLASCELFLIAMGSLLISTARRAPAPRIVGAVAGAAVVIANILASFTDIRCLIAGRLLSGLSMGALLGVVNGVAARRADAHRVLALMQGSMVALLSVIYFAAPTLMGRYGLAGLLLNFVIVGTLFSVAAWMALPPSAARYVGSPTSGQSRWLAPTMGCLGLSGALISQNTVWTYIIAIGADRGFDSRTMGTLLALCGPLYMLGPIVARLLGERSGLKPPLLAALAIIALDLLLIPHIHSLVVFGICTTMLNALILFSVPYAITLLGRLDPTGRFSSAAPAFMMIGAAVGPALGSNMAVAGRFTPLVTLAAAIAVGSIILFQLATSVGMRGAGAHTARAP